VLLVVVLVPPLRPFFAFDAVTPLELALALASGFVAVTWFELAKPWRTSGRRDTGVRSR
jgi:hypothetical protein